MSQQSTIPLPDLPGIGPGWELLGMDAERSRRCTGTTAAADAGRREAILSACIHVGTRRAAQAYGVSREVVRALKLEAVRSGKLDQMKEEAGRRALGAADLILDRIIDEVDDLPRAQLPIAYGILKDKGLLLTGQPTARIEHTVTVDHATLNDLIESLPAAQPVPAGDPAPQKALELEAVTVDLDTAAARALSPAGDRQSPVSCPSSEGAAAGGANSGQNGAQKEAGA